jgi:hypothetical protein
MKTNQQWYPYPEFGSYYKLEGGELYQCPMNVDSSRADSPAKVYFWFGIELAEVPALEAIKKYLELKD